MTAEQIQAYLGAAAFLIAFIVGLDSSLWLRRRYNEAKPRIDERNRAIMFVIVLASWMITGAAGWIGALSSIRLVFQVSIPWTPPITLLIATAIVFIPRMFKEAIKKVIGETDEPEGQQSLAVQPSTVQPQKESSVKIFGREPTLWLAGIYAILTVLGTTGLAHFSGAQANLTNAAIAAIVGAINAYAVKPISPVSFTYAIAAIVQLAAAYGILIPAETLTAINGLAVPALALLSRGQVSPVETAITRKTTADEKAVAEPGTGAPPSATVS